MQNYFLLINPFAYSALTRRNLIPYAHAFRRPGERPHTRRLGLILLLFALSLPVYAQEFVPEQVVFPITDFKPDIKDLAPFP